MCYLPEVCQRARSSSRGFGFPCSNGRTSTRTPKTHFSRRSSESGLEELEFNVHICRSAVIAECRSGILYRIYRIC
eukprot:scaffold28024_cov39-Prasinocladus_malaysianus.AAC.1